MAQSNSLLNSIVELLTRGVIGFAAGIIFTWLGLTFLGVLQGHNDLSQPELDEEIRGQWLALGFACGAAVIAMLIGRRRVSTFWLWFGIVFAVICIVPFWPHKDGSLLPFGTPYVNFGFQTSDAILLAIHVSLALFAAAVAHWTWPILRQRIKKAKSP